MKKKVALYTIITMSTQRNKKTKQNNRSHVDMLFDLLPSQITATNRK